MTLDQLVRTHRELSLILGFKSDMRGPGIYTYQAFTNDMNTVHPDIVRSVYQMSNAMRGWIRVPLYWQKPINELLELAISGNSEPPTRGPMWHPFPTSRSVRAALIKVLPLWRRKTKLSLGDVAIGAQIPRGRIFKLSKGTTAIAPTELERIAVVFGTDRAGLLAGP